MSSLKNRGLSNGDLWDIAKFIVDKQKSSDLIPHDTKKYIDQNELEAEWFDWLEEKLEEDDISIKR